MNAAGLPVMFPLQREIACHEEAERGGRINAAERRGEDKPDVISRQDWHQPLRGLLSAAAD